MMLCCVASVQMASFYPTIQHHTPVEFISKFTTIATSDLLTYVDLSACVFPSVNASSDQFTSSQPISIGWVLGI